MNVLLLGSGGREHALAWKISQSPLLTKLYIAPGNAGTALCGKNISLNVNDFSSIKEFVVKTKIDMVIVGPEDSLVKGIKDYFNHDPQLKNVAIIGPDSKGALLEGSKDYAKRFMLKYNIPTARYKSFDSNLCEQAFAYLKEMAPPYVLKADGLAAGKGVVILNDKLKAEEEIESILINKKFGEAGSKLVIEEFLDGIELSVFVLTDGDSYLMLPAAKDYKRIGEGDTGLNTGGMGAVSPVPFANKSFLDKVEQKIINPTINGLKNEGVNYKGFLFFGLMNVGGEPFVIEYNVRMGDPEAEVVIPRINNDLLEIFVKLDKATLKEVKLKINTDVATTVMLVSKGYPESYEKRKKISGLNLTNEKSMVFHAGTLTDHNQLYTNGGRVLCITSLADNKENALKLSYEAADKISFDGKYFRRDIGFDI